MNAPGTHFPGATFGSMAEPLILIVDDEALLRMLATDYFEDGGYEVLSACDGAEAIDILKRRPDTRAVFTDVQMPGRPDGFGVAREAVKEILGCAVIVASARQCPQDDPLADGVQFLTKPYDGTTVVKMFDDMLARKAS